jgi:hypothetical protein
MKMHRRITSWQGLGLINNLWNYKFGMDELQDQFRSSPPDSEDRYLATFINSNPEIIKVLREIKANVSFNALTTAAMSGAAVYTKETACEFHELLVTVFVMYARALCRFHTLENASKKASNSPDKLDNASKKASNSPDKLDNASKKASNSPSDLEKCFNALEGFTRFLLCIITSPSFKKHIRVCTQEGATLRHLIPSFDHRNEYKLFGRSVGIILPQDTNDEPNENSESKAMEVCEAFPLCKHDAEQVLCSYWQLTKSNLTLKRQWRYVKLFLYVNMVLSKFCAVTGR